MQEILTNLKIHLPKVIEREKNIALEHVKANGKPAEMVEKIAMGKINKFFKDSALLTKPFL